MLLAVDADERWAKIGREMKVVRKSLGHSTTAAARRIGLKSQGHVSDLEKGKHRPSPEQLAALEEFYGLPLGYFLRLGGFVADETKFDTRDVIRNDALLGPLQKAALIAAYDSFVSDSQRG